MGSFIKKKSPTTFQSRLMRFMGEMVGMTVVLLLLSVVFISLMNENYQKNMQQLVNLNAFYHHLDSINHNVYNYTLEGDEEIYKGIETEMLEGRGILKELTEVPMGIRFYRDVRDIQEMFYTYTTSIDKIYEHSYLCEVMTVGSKAVINKYYSATQEVYQAMTDEFQNLYSQLLDNAENQARMLELRNRIYYVFILVVMLSTIGYELFQVGNITKRVIAPVQELTEKARTFEGHQISQAVCSIPQEVDDEMEHLLQVYNSMVLRIQKQMEEIQENASAKERLKNQELENLRINNRLKSSELKALQMQINPHFLFNTLNMISQTAYMESAEDTAALLGTTARLLRYTLDNTDKAVTLAREIEILGNYVELQEKRFGERISFEFDLDESFHQMVVPSMILQPLVENSISHGVGIKREGGKIKICTRYDAQHKRGIIVVSDNGIGMDEKTLERVRQDIRVLDRPGQRIGLGNVYLRLMIFFNHKAEMKVFSRPEAGTRIVLSLPCEESEDRKEGDLNVSDRCGR